MPGKSLFGARFLTGCSVHFKIACTPRKCTKNISTKRILCLRRKIAGALSFPSDRFADRVFFSWVRKYRSKNAIFDLYSVIYGRFNSRFTFII